MSVWAAQQGYMQSAGRIGRPDVVGETSPSPEMTIVFSPRKGLAEESGGPARRHPAPPTRPPTTPAPVAGGNGFRLGGTATSRPPPNRVNDVLIPGAPAEISLEPGADPFFARLRFALKQLQRAHDHARGAESALQRVMLTKRRQQGMLTVTGLAQGLDCVNRRTVRLDGQDRACLHGAAVEVHGARAALGGIASDVGDW